MNESALWPLVGLALTTGVLHTLAGPDHYVPFVVLSRARGWSRRKTAVITAVCGVGHVLGSVVLGLIGIGAGLAITRLEAVEAVRGDWAAWAMIAFGLVYAVWGMRRRGTGHWHPFGIGRHVHTGHQHGHEAEESARRQNLTPWVLFLVFVLGPCELLIPLLLYPAAADLSHVAIVATAFGLATVATMLVAVLALVQGTRRWSWPWLERHAHPVAGAVTAACGVLILLGF